MMIFVLAVITLALCIVSALAVSPRWWEWARVCFAAWLLLSLDVLLKVL